MTITPAAFKAVQKFVLDRCADMARTASGSGTDGHMRALAYEMLANEVRRMDPSSIPGLTVAGEDAREPLRADAMTMRGELFAIRFVDGCSNGCAELFIEDDEWWHFVTGFDRVWLGDLKSVIDAALTTAPGKEER